MGGKPSSFALQGPSLGSKKSSTNKQSRESRGSKGTPPLTGPGAQERNTGEGIGTPTQVPQIPRTPRLQDRVTINLAGGYDPAYLVPHLWTLVAGANNPPELFLTEAGEVVRLEIRDGRPELVALTPDRLARAVHHVVQFEYETQRSYRLLSAPKSVLTEMLACKASDIPLPTLREVATAPIVGTSFEVLTSSGYHQTLEAYLHWESPLLTVPNRPTRADLEKAVAIIRKPLQDFPFVDEASLATAVAAMLTPFVRRFIHGPTPLHLIEKATPGTGASLLVDALLAPSLGDTVQKMSAPSNDGEWAYSLAAVLRPLPPAVVIDNARELTSRELAKVLTDSALVARIVRTSNVAVVPIRTTWLATGNNPRLHQEIRRRVVRCRLDAGVEEPWRGRTFRIPNLKAWLREHRAEMIWACLTIVKSWHAAGEPKGTQNLGMYEDYSAIVGGILEHAGFHGFLEWSEDESTDLQTETERWVVATMFEQHRGDSVGVSDVIEWATAEDSPLLELWGADVRPQSYPQRLGLFLKDITDKTFTLDGARVRLVKRPEHPTKRTSRYAIELAPRSKLSATA